MLLVVALLAWVMLGIGTGLAQDGETEVAKAKAPVAWGKGVPPLDVHSLDDPQNPYHGQYGAWDYWFFEHAGTPNEEMQHESYMGTAPANWLSVDIRVDSNGYPVPYLVSLHYKYSQIALGEPYGMAYRYESYGEMPYELWDEYQDAILKVNAQFISPIPAWLADNPPLVARIWTDGSVITHGPLGSWNGEGDVVPNGKGGWHYLPDPYYLYSPDGELICRTAWDDWEQNVFTGPFNPDDPLDALFYSGWADKVFWHSRACGWRGPGIINAYWVLYDSNTRERLVIYDWDGTKLPADFDINARDANKTGRLMGGNLKKLRQFQLELGIVEE